MGKIKNFFFRNSTNKEDSSVWFDDPVLSALFSGKELNRSNVTSIPQVASNVDKICSTFALLPIKLYRRTEEDGYPKVEEVDDLRVKMLNDDTNDTFDGYQFKRAMCEDYLLDKGGYAYIEKQRNFVKGIYHVEPMNIAIAKNADPIHKKYEVWCYDKHYQPYEWLKLLRNTKDGMQGQGVTDEVNEALQTARAMMIFQLQLMRKGGNKKGFIQSDRNLGTDEQIALKNAWQRLYSSNDSDNTVILNKGLTFKESSNTALELQLVQSIKNLNSEIDAIFHMSDNYDQFIKDAILPICNAFKAALNRDLLLEREKDTYFFDFDFSEILKASQKERFESYKLAKEAGWITKNEIRSMENLTRIEGLDTVDVGLGSTLYNVNTKEYFVPNTGQTKGTGSSSPTIEEGGEE